MAINHWVCRDKAWGKQGQSFANVMINLKKESFLIVAIMGNSGVVRYDIIHGKASKDKYEALLD